MRVQVADHMRSTALAGMVWEFNEPIGPYVADEKLPPIDPSAITLTKNEYVIVMEMWRERASLQRHRSGQYSIAAHPSDKFIKTRYGDRLIAKGILSQWCFYSDANESSFHLRDDICKALKRGFRFTIYPAIKETQND